MLPITNGTPSSDEAVVALVHGDVLVCSGAMIAPQLVLTAAHCLADAHLPDVAIGPAVIGAEHHAVIAAFVHPLFQAATLDHDLALLLVDPPLTIAPIPYLNFAESLTRPIRIAGYGFTIADDTSPATRLTGATMESDSDELSFTTRSTPSQACEGDSGGPALYSDPGAERVVGVASSGDATCSSFAKYTRVDAHADYIAQLVTATSISGALAGDRCYYAANCGDGACTPALDDPRLMFCATACDGGCADGLACISGRCRHPTPSPGAIGSPCSLDSQCIDALCTAPRGTAETVCTVHCFNDLPGFTCPNDTACGAAADAQQACFTAVAAGCSASRGDASWLLALLFGLRIRRRVVVNDPPAR